MSKTRTLFPGAMGPDGFISCFDDLADERALRRRIILKGGPGVGKSTFMRRVHAKLTADGAPSTLCFCSGDPDSLDAVVLPEQGIIVLDGTAPHIVDPVIPGARDSIVNLGECLDEESMRPMLDAIRACMEDNAAYARRARANLQAAAALRRDNALLIDGMTDVAARKRLTTALSASVLTQSGEKTETPRVRRVITDAVTPKGEISFLSEHGMEHPRVLRIARHWAQDVTLVLCAVRDAALAAGYDVQAHLWPAQPGWLLHLTIPALSTIITTSDQLAAEQTFDFSACLQTGGLLRLSGLLEQGRAGASLHMHRAVSALAQAKTLHDQLETHYVPNMDFARWQKILDNTILRLK